MYYLDLQEMLASQKTQCQLNKFDCLTKSELKKMIHQKQMQLQYQMNSIFGGDIDEFIERMTDDLSLLVYLNSKI